MIWCSNFQAYAKGKTSHPTYKPTSHKKLTHVKPKMVSKINTKKSSKKPVIKAKNKSPLKKVSKSKSHHLTHSKSKKQAKPSIKQVNRSNLQSTVKTVVPRLAKLFNVSPNLSIQSIAYLNNDFFVGVDTPENDSIIYKYDALGHELGHTGTLPILHAASLSANPLNGHLYVTNGGATNPTKIYEVDFDTQQILSTIDLSKLGNSGLSAIDQITGNLWVETAPNDHGSQTFSYCDTNGNVLKQFSIPNQGVPQGIEYRNGFIYLYTNNKITVINTDGKVLRNLNVNEPGESEGMVILPSGEFVVGFNVRQTASYHLGEFFLIKNFK